MRAIPKNMTGAVLPGNSTVEFKTFKVPEPGERELRIMTPAGASNPLFFHVGTLPEIVESTDWPQISAPACTKQS